MLNKYRLLSTASLLSVATLSLLVPSAGAAVIKTSQGATNLASPFAWEGMVVPGAADTAEIAHPGDYAVLNGSIVDFGGIVIRSEGVAFDDNASFAVPGQINLGAGGISSTETLGRVGRHNSPNSSLRIEVVENQTWDFVATNGVGADIRGTKVITYTNPSRLWLRGANWGFAGTWRSDGGFIHPDTNSQWSGASGALGQVLNGGIIRLSNLIYDRVWIDAVGDGFLRVTGAGSNNGSFATLSRGAAPASGSIRGVGNLTFDSHGNYGKLVLNGDVLLRGNAIVADEEEGMYVELSPSSSYTAVISADGSNNVIMGMSAATSHLTVNGTVIIRPKAGSYSGGSWTLLDPAALNISYGNQFAVADFTEAGQGIWTLTQGNAVWTFSEATGVLTLSGDIVIDAFAYWAGYPMDENNFAETGDFLGSIYVLNDWIFAYATGGWIYLPEGNVMDSGTWMWVPLRESGSTMAGVSWLGFNLDENNRTDTGDFLGSVYVFGDFVYAVDLRSWLYLPEQQAAEAGRWAWSPES